MVLGGRGYIFTMVTSMMVLIILSLVMFQTQVFTPAYEDTLTKISLNELHYFVEALKKDAGRAGAISAQRSAAYTIDHIIKTNESFAGYVMSNCTEFNYYATGVEAAFANTGSVVLTPAPGRSRIASLLPLHHLILVPLSKIYPTFEDWLAKLRKEGHLETFVRESGQIAFITGPSKSADIELNLTLGVHGPKVVHAIVFDDKE